MTVSLSIDRASLSLAALTISDTPSGSLWFDGEGVGRPAFSLRKSYAPESDHMPGRVLLSAVSDIGGLPASFYAKAATTAALESLKDEVDAAFSQFVYTVTLTVDGVARSYTAECELPTWTDFDQGLVSAFMAHASIVIPIAPGA